MEFKLTEIQMEKLNNWLVRVNATAASISPDPVIPNLPYYGAIGGGLIFSFLPTGLGTIVLVKETITGEEIDLTDYDAW